MTFGCFKKILHLFKTGDTLFFWLNLMKVVSSMKIALPGFKNDWLFF
jgi:hypothetical protein